MQDLARPLSPAVQQWVVLAGLCMLIPLPILDDWCEVQCTRRAFRALAAERGVELDKHTLDLLTAEGFSIAQGCLALIKWPFKKLFRLVLYFLTIKDVLDRAAHSALRVEMVSHALDAGLLPVDAARVRVAMDIAIGQHHTSPVIRWILRHPRPALPRLVGPMGWLMVQSGAGLVLPRFEEQVKLGR